MVSLRGRSAIRSVWWKSSKSRVSGSNSAKSRAAGLSFKVASTGRPSRVTRMSMAVFLSDGAVVPRMSASAARMVVAQSGGGWAGMSVQAVTVSSRAVAVTARARMRRAAGFTGSSRG